MDPTSVQPMIVMFTDFGIQGPYLGQMEAVLRSCAPECAVVNLLCDAPMGDPKRSAYLLAAFGRDFPEGSVFLCVVDPGVGGERRAVAMEADGRWYVGPDNGLLNSVAQQAKRVSWRTIVWRPEKLSSSFHGRDLFAPVAAAIARGEGADLLADMPSPDLAGWPADLDEVIYFDHYGNAITGRRWARDLDRLALDIHGRQLRRADTFCAVAEGEPFWYCNSSGLVEIAVNRGRADRTLGLKIGAPIQFLAPAHRAIP